MNYYPHTFFLLLSLIFGVQSSAYTQDKAALQKQLENIIYYDCKINFEATPGFIVGLIIGDSTYVYSYGSQSKKEDTPIETTTLFEMGGASKIFTSSLIEILVQKGKMDYNAAFPKYIGLANKIYSEKTPSLLDVVAHRAGLPRLPTDFGVKELDSSNPYAFYAKKDLAQFYKNYKIPEGDFLYNYSNLGYSLLESSIEQVCSKSFEESLKEHFLNPKQLNNTFISLSKKQTNQLSPGHSFMGKEVDAWKAPSFGGAVGVKSSMEDLVKIIRLQFNDRTFATMHQPLEKTLVDKNSYAAKGWHVIRLKKYYNIVAHSGSTAGHRIFMGFIKETNTGVIVLSNSKAGTNELGYLSLKMLNNSFKLTPEQKRGKVENASR